LQPRSEDAAKGVNGVVAALFTVAVRSLSAMSKADYWSSAGAAAMAAMYWLNCGAWVCVRFGWTKQPIISAISIMMIFDVIAPSPSGTTHGAAKVVLPQPIWRAGAFFLIPGRRH
jgi:hypothetical protein